jgi:hypothetical protein
LFFTLNWLKFNLIIWLLIYVNCTPNWLQTSDLMQFCSCWISKSAPNFSAILSLVLGLRFIQFDPELIIKLLIFFNSTPNFHQLGPYSLMFFADWSLAVNFFNLTPNWPKNFFFFFVILPLILFNWLGKNHIWSLKILIFSIKPKLVSQTYFFTN